MKEDTKETGLRLLKKGQAGDPQGGLQPFRTDPCPSCCTGSVPVQYFPLV